MHTTHNEPAPEATVTPGPSIDCGENADAEKRRAAAYREVVSPPEMVAAEHVGSDLPAQPVAPQATDCQPLTGGQSLGR
jgi:hypothetical protein